TDAINKAGGVLGRQLEIVPFDNKVSPQESLIQLKKVIGDGIQFVFQGNSSGVAHAISDAVQKHNERNAGNRVLYLNYSAVDPALTNEKCHYWHFRFDAPITGNWGADMVALAKAANDGGLKVPFYTYYAASNGITAAIGAAGIDRIRLVHETHPANPNSPKALSDYITGFRKLHAQDDINQPRINTGLSMLAQAIKRAGTTDVDKAAAALEGAECTT